MADAIDAMLDYHLRSAHYPGALVHIEQDGQVCASRCAGRQLGDDDSAPLERLSRFRIASLSKPMVSAVALMLVADGRLALDAAASELLPELDAKRMPDGSAAGRGPTIRDLMRHTAGVPYLPEIPDAAVREQAVAAGLHKMSLMSRTAFVEALAALPYVARPGTRFQYGYGTDLLGIAIERACSAKLSDVMRTRLFEPLGMRDTGFRCAPAEHAAMPRAFAGDRAWHAFVDGFDEADRRHAQGDDALLESAGGGLVSTLDDLAAFARFVASGGIDADGQRRLDPALRTEMLSDQLGAGIDGPHGYSGPGFGFGLAGAIRLDYGAAAIPSVAGEFTWSGVTGQALYIEPSRQWFAIMLSANTASRLPVRLEFRRAASLLPEAP